MRGEPKDQVGGTAGPSEAVSLSGHGCGVSGQMVTVNVPQAVVAEAPWGSEQTSSCWGVPKDVCTHSRSGSLPSLGTRSWVRPRPVKEKTAVDSVPGEGHSPAEPRAGTCLSGSPEGLLEVAAYQLVLEVEVCRIDHTA